MQVFVHVTLYRQEAFGIFLGPDWPVVLTHHDIGAVTETFQRYIDVVGPGAGVAHGSTANGIHVVHVLAGDFRGVQDLECREVHHHLGLGLGAVSHLKLDFYTIDGQSAVVRHGIGRCDQ